jgi:hypothetical protein
MRTNSKAGAVLAGRRRTETFERIARCVFPRSPNLIFVRDGPTAACSGNAGDDAHVAHGTTVKSSQGALVLRTVMCSPRGLD